MTSKQKAVALVEMISKEKDFYEISQLRQELDYCLDRIEEIKVRAYLKKAEKERLTVFVQSDT